MASSHPLLGNLGPEWDPGPLGFLGRRGTRDRLTIVPVLVPMILDPLELRAFVLSPFYINRTRAKGRYPLVFREYFLL